jgi:hypothetical protein
MKALLFALAVFAVCGYYALTSTACNPVHATAPQAITDTVTISVQNSNQALVLFKQKSGPSTTFTAYTSGAYLHYYLEYDTTGADTFKVRARETSIVYKYYPTATFYVRVTTPNSTVGNSFNVQNYTNWKWFFTPSGCDTVLNVGTVLRDSMNSWGCITAGQMILNTDSASGAGKLQFKKATSGFTTL